MVNFCHKRTHVDIDKSAKFLANNVTKKGFITCANASLVRRVHVSLPNGVQHVVVAQDCMFEALRAISRVRGIQAPCSPFDASKNEVGILAEAVVLRQVAVRHVSEVLKKETHPMHGSLKKLHDEAQDRWRQESTAEEVEMWGGDFGNRWTAGMLHDDTSPTQGEPL